MNILKAIIIDDEKHNVENLAMLLKKYCPQVQVVATANDANEGKTLLMRYHPDVLFLDIQMPGKDGFDLLREIPSPDFDLIFVTAYDQFAIRAIKFSAMDYLLKPLNIDELMLAVSRVQAKREASLTNMHFQNLIHFLQFQKTEHRIALHTLKETRYVKTSEIIRCESANNYTFFFLSNGEKLTVSKPIYEFEELLEPYGFFRSHQSHLINRQFVKSLVKENGGYLLLEGGSTVPVSRNKKELLLQFLNSGSGV